jgi:hypothetical protein
MTPNKIFVQALTATAVVLASSAHGADAPRLQLRDVGAIEEWRGDGPTIVYVKNKTDQWYKVELYESCMSEDTSKGVQFLTTRDFDTDKMVSRVVVNRHICRVVWIETVKTPPKTAKGPTTAK